MVRRTDVNVTVVNTGSGVSNTAVVSLSSTTRSETTSTMVLVSELVATLLSLSWSSYSASLFFFFFFTSTRWRASSRVRPCRQIGPHRSLDSSPAPISTSVVFRRLCLCFFLFLLLLPIPLLRKARNRLPSALLLHFVLVENDDDEGRDDDDDDAAKALSDALSLSVSFVVVVVVFVAVVVVRDGGRRRRCFEPRQANILSIVRSVMRMVAVMCTACCGQVTEKEKERQRWPRGKTETTHEFSTQVAIAVKLGAYTINKDDTLRTRAFHKK